MSKTARCVEGWARAVRKSGIRIMVKIRQHDGLDTHHAGSQGSKAYSRAYPFVVTLALPDVQDSIQLAFAWRESPVQKRIIPRFFHEGTVVIALA